MINYDITYEITDDLNKLFCTFTEKTTLDQTLNIIQSNYTILYSKIFVLQSEDTTEYVCTYNVDTVNMRDNKIIDNTILAHRNKSTNTLYTINSLNELVKSLNGGMTDRNFKINWEDYRNCILLTRQGELVRLNTSIHNIIDLS
jgi:hypothetical protein